MEIAWPPEKFFMRHATSIAIALVTLLTCAALLLFWEQAKENRDAKDWLLHSFEVRGHIRQLNSGVQKMAISHNDFIITGEEQDLDSYHAVQRDLPSATLEQTTADIKRSIGQEVAILRQQTADNPRQQNNIDQLELALADLIKHYNDNIEARRKPDGKAALALRQSRSSELLNRVAEMTNLMMEEETHLISLRVEKEELTTLQGQRMTLIGAGVFYMLTVLSIWLYQRARRLAEIRLQHYAQQLERSEEELKMQQEELRASNEEIEASNEELEEKSRSLEEKNTQLQLATAELNRSRQTIEEKINEVEQASRYKSEFLANMSHELRTPLNSLLILAKLLADNEEKNLTADQVEDAKIIYNGGMELLSLINDILDLSKVEAGKINILLDDAQIEALAARMQQQFTPVSKQRQLEFVLKVASNLPATIRTDMQRVEQIIKNLLSNAFKFTEAGSVTLEIRRADKNRELTYSGMDMESALALSVTDTGVGIDSSKFKDIFEAFQQEDGSVDRHYGGTGLGLTIARKFAHLLGGEIHVASEKGKGSTFTLLLPTHIDAPRSEATLPKNINMPATNHPAPGKLPPPAALVADDRASINATDRVLLIIEDDATFAKLLLKIAHTRGYKCLCASDGESGLILARSQNVNAVILDLNLPDMDGMQVLAQLKNNPKTRHLPVHVMSGRDNSNQQSLQQGALAHSIKPVERAEIEGALSKLEEIIQAGTKHVLVIEGNTQTQQDIRQLLQKSDVHVSLAKSGTEGMQLLREGRFGCIILDFRLTDTTAHAWLQEAGAALAAPLPPVIIYTNHSLSEEENKQLAELTDSIIIKGAKSSERLLDEVTLFLHSVQSSLPHEQQENVRMQHDHARALQGHTVLLVDDDLRNTFALSKLLKRQGLNIEIADNGQMALDKLKQNPAIELVIMDIMMPIMDGYQAMRAIRADAQLKHLPIIPLTARAMPDEIEKCMQAGANDYLTKPVDIERLLALLRVWLARPEGAA